jgi:hypothetical protein
MKKNLTGQIIDIFKSKLGWTAYYFETQNDKKHGNLDGQLQLNIDQDAIHLVCEVKKSVVPSSIASIKHAIENTQINILEAQGVILLANYISTKAREILIENNINYADTGGNIYLKYNNIHIHIETGQSDRSSLDGSNGRAFTKTGLKVLYQFFRSEERLDENNNIITIDIPELDDTLRELSHHSITSKDTVSKVIQDLLEQGYILKKNKSEFVWKNKKAVFERWVSRVNEILRPSLAAKKYRLLGEPIVHGVIPLGYQLGGYQGAERWLRLEPSKQIINAPYLIYTHKGYSDLTKDLSIVPDTKGQISVVEAFWKDDSNISPSADFPVLYADLINSNDPRMMEVAQLIYKNYLHDKL